MIINSNEIHSIHARMKNQTVVLQIPLNQFENYFTAQRFIRFQKHGNAGTGDCDARLFAGVRELYQVYTSRENGYEFRVMSLFYEVLYLLVTGYRETEVREKRNPIQQTPGGSGENYRLYAGALHGGPEACRCRSPFRIFSGVSFQNV